jgi:hypothetical protein
MGSSSQNCSPQSSHSQVTSGMSKSRSSASPLDASSSSSAWGEPIRESVEATERRRAGGMFAEDVSGDGEKEKEELKFYSICSLLPLPPALYLSYDLG